MNFFHGRYLEDQNHDFQPDFGHDNGHFSAQNGYFGNGHFNCKIRNLNSFFFEIIIYYF